MTVLAAAGTVTTAPVDSVDPVGPAQHTRPALGVVHDHDWRLVQVDWSDGVCVKEFSCADCSAVWFA